MGIQPSEIRNIIFDLGGVLLNINPLLSLLEFERLSGISREELTKRLAKEHIFEKIAVTFYKKFFWCVVFSESGFF